VRPADPLAALREDIVFDAGLGRHRFRFHSTWGLFSPREIDAGTRLLVQHMDIPPAADCLDLGCGYGPLGLYMAREAPEGRTLLVDKDFVAVDYARANLARNGIDNAEAQLSNGFQHIDPARRFDVIASNIPAKVGKELLTLLLHDARARLRPGGVLYVVTINGLRQFMKRHLREVFGHYEKLKQSTHYTAACAFKSDS